MASDSGPFVVWSQYLAARTAAAALTALPVQTNLAVAARVGRIWQTADRRHRYRARHNIALSFPEWSPEKIDNVTARSFEHFTQLAVEVLYTPRLLNLGNWADHLVLRDLGRALEVLNRGRGAILLTGHLGNWEVLGYAMALLGYELDAIARPIDNPLINRWLLGIRERRGMRIITKWNATARMFEVLNRGGGLAFIADQNAGDKGFFVPFFGRLASTYKSIGLLAMRRKLPVVCGYAHRLNHEFRYEIGVTDIIEPEEWQDQPDPLFYITARYSRAMETMIRRRPEQYLWMHRRWKSRPLFERQGRAMPIPLRRKLEALPWMDEAQLSRLQQPVPPTPP